MNDRNRANSLSGDALFELFRGHVAGEAPNAWSPVTPVARGGNVANSSAVSPASAPSRFAPHISLVGRRLTQNAGRSGWPKSAQRKSGSNCTHGIPAGLPCGMPGIGVVIEGAMQHAPQPARQSMG
jgi:hypothetical protein